jgi:dTDP-glucose 4,6-dehydratase
VVDEICRGVDAAFVRDPSLVHRFPRAPAARGDSASLKSYVEDRKGHDRCYAIDETKARDRLGYITARDFAEGFAATLGWYLEREDWWGPLLP